MVTQRKEPTVSSVLNSKEDSATKRSRTPISQHPRTVQRKVSLPGEIRVALALLLALVAAVTAGASYWQLMSAQSILQDQQMHLQSQQQRIAELENRLALSDDESTQSLVAVSAKLKEANSEIRKLWGVSYDTNRKAIKANKTAISSQQQNAKALDGALKIQQSALNDNNQRLSEQELLLRTLRERVNEQSASLKSMSTAIADARERIKNSEEAIEGIDVFRRSVSRDLLAIKQQINQQPAKTPATVK